MTQIRTISLPLPSRKLSPNARIHWAQRSKLVKAHRLTAYAQTLRQCGLFKANSYRLVFFWPDKRRRDRDNASAMCKAYLDGISDAIRQDDSEWRFDGVAFDLDRDNPRVEVRMGEAFEDQPQLSI